MKKENLQKIISICIAMLAMLPMSIQFAHALEDHSHDICEENNMQHFHNHELDCEFDHYLFELNAVSIAKTTKQNNPVYSDKTVSFFGNTYFQSSYLRLKSRGPPYPII